MTRLTSSERDFLELGGAVWCIKENTEGKWDIYRLTWEFIDTLNFSVESEETASNWAYLLADLSVPPERVTLHHAIRRRYGDPSYPQLSIRQSDKQSFQMALTSGENRSFTQWVRRALAAAKNRSIRQFRFARQAIKFTSSHVGRMAECTPQEIST